VKILKSHLLNKNGSLTLKPPPQPPLIFWMIDEISTRKLILLMALNLPEKS
jgi:hypothetical protein